MNPFRELKGPDMKAKLLLLISLSPLLTHCQLAKELNTTWEKQNHQVPTEKRENRFEKYIGKRGILIFPPKTANGHRVTDFARCADVEIVKIGNEATCEYDQKSFSCQEVTFKQGEKEVSFYDTILSESRLALCDAGLMPSPDFQKTYNPKVTVEGKKVNSLDLACQGQLTAGMPSSLVLFVKGEPQGKTETMREGTKREQWVYKSPEGLVQEIYSVQDDKVTGIQKLEP